MALGCMGMSGMYGHADERESIATIHEALERGVNYDSIRVTSTVWATTRCCFGRALAGRRQDAILSVKFGALRDPGGGWLGVDMRPAAVKTFLTYSLKRLGTDYVDVYRPARLDPKVPIEETVEPAIADMVKAGYARAVGLSEVGVETITRAHRTHPITDLQIEYSLISRAPEAKNLFRYCASVGVSVTAYGVLSRGLLSKRLGAQGRDRLSRAPAALRR